MKPAREEPEARANARLATNSDFPTFGSPPTKRIPEDGNNPGPMRAGVGAGLCSSNWPSDNTPEVEELFFKAGFTAMPPESHPARWAHQSWTSCVTPPDAEPSRRVCGLCGGRPWWLERAPGAPCHQTGVDAHLRL